MNQQHCELVAGVSYDPSSQRNIGPCVASRREGYFLVGKSVLLGVFIRHAPVGRGDAQGHGIGDIRIGAGQQECNRQGGEEDS